MARAGQRAFLSLMLACGAALGDERVECWQTVPVPRYPPIARQARVQGNVHIQIGPDLQVPKPAQSDGRNHPLLVPAVMEALNASRIPAACAGRAMVFSFRIQGDPPPWPYPPNELLQVVVRRADHVIEIWVPYSPLNVLREVQSSAPQ